MRMALIQPPTLMRSTNRACSRPSYPLSGEGWGYRVCPSAKSCAQLVRAACRWGGCLRGMSTRSSSCFATETSRQIELVAEEARAGKLFGVWNTDDSNGLRLIHRHGRSWLEGRKILASGAGHIERPLVTATDEDGRRLMVLPKLSAPDRADLSRWTAQGMRASATGAVDFTGVEIQPIEIVGGDGDYERQPWFSAGAWRFAAVHLGGMERLFDLLRRHLQETNRGQDPHQAARLGGAAMAVETARLWVAQAASIRKVLWDRERRSSSSPTSISRALRWRRRLSILCSLSSAQSGFRPSCVRTRSSAYRVILQPIFASQARIAR